MRGLGRWRRRGRRPRSPLDVHAAAEQRHTDRHRHQSHPHGGLLLQLCVAIAPERAAEVSVHDGGRHRRSTSLRPSPSPSSRATGGLSRRPSHRGSGGLGRRLLLRAPEHGEQEQGAADAGDGGDEQARPADRARARSAWSIDHSPGAEAAEREPGDQQGEDVLVALARPEDEEAVRQVVGDEARPPSRPTTPAPRSGVRKPRISIRPAHQLGEAGQPRVEDAGLHARGSRTSRRCPRSSRPARCGCSRGANIVMPTTQRSSSRAMSTPTLSIVMVPTLVGRPGPLRMTTVSANAHATGAISDEVSGST